MPDIKTDPNEPENPRRRKFLIGLITLMGGFITFILGGSGLFYFLSPAFQRKKENWVELGPLSGLKEGEPVKVDYLQRQADGWETIEKPDTVWVLKQKDQVVAYDSHCTHLGCHYRWDSSKDSFICPCHGGVFSREGLVVSGPPPRPLSRLSVKTENGVLFILPVEKKT
jgi:menaquinol-cytochrome c reductase iron-sulfur subunit